MVETNWRPSPHFKPQTGIPKLFIVDHWMVGYLDSTTAGFTTSSRRVSTNFGIGQSRIDQYVLEKDYAYGSGTAYANSRGISIEHEGGYLLPGGDRAKPSDAVHELSAQLHADLSRRHGLGRLEVGRNVFPHSHFVATACPGTLDLQRIVARANELLGAAPAHAAPAVSKPAPAAGLIVVDGIFGRQTIRALQADLGTIVDGIFGPVTVKALQRRLGAGVVVDGIFGKQTILALQRRLGNVVPDGIFGRQTKTALQRRLNAGTI